MTDTASVASVNTPDALRLGSVGRPLPGVQARIADDGGILIKGPNIFNGYFRDAEATLATLVDGWLHTGDLGRVDEDGFLFITGRQKEIIITAGGKIITPTNLENALRHNRWISQAIVLGDGRAYLAALITLDAEEAPAFASQHNLKLDELPRSESMRTEIQTAIDEINSHYAPVEQIKRFEILPNDFSRPTGELHTNGHYGRPRLAPATSMPKPSMSRAPALPAGASADTGARQAPALKANARASFASLTSRLQSEARIAIAIQPPLWARKGCAPEVRADRTGRASS
jgi:long-subunit acyl-CoA synthetase (AMP-forming)